MDRKNAGNIEQCYRLLALCARAQPHLLMVEQLSRQLETFTAWDDLPSQAEIHGMGPLLWYHLKNANLSIPLGPQRIISGLYLRHRKWNEFNTQTLLEVTALFEGAGIRAVVLKGLGLAHEYYPDPALRPASDIDLLLKKDDTLPALNLLREAGYKISTPQTSIPNLLPKELTADSPPRDGFSTHIELHHYDPRHVVTRGSKRDDEFGHFDAVPHTIQIGDGEIHVPDAMDTLGYVCRHFKRHLFDATTEKPLQLKWIADIISVVERHATEMDWRIIKKEDPALLNRLEVFYCLTPLPEHLVDVIPVRQIATPFGINQYPQGWPRYGIRMQKRKNLLRFLKATFTPPSNWWLSLYYGIGKGSYIWYGHVLHRIHLLSLMFWTLAGK